MNKIQNIIARARLKISKDQTYYVDEEDFDLITDEIERSLLEMKDVYDIPTSEIERSVVSRRESIKKRDKNTR